MLHQQFHVLRVIGLAPGLERLDLGQRRLIHGRHQHLVGVVVVRRDAGHHAGDDQPAQMLLVVQRILDAQDATPGVAEQDEVVPIQPERLTDLLHLIDEAVQVP